MPGLPTALHTSGGTGRRGPGPAASRRQPAQPDRHAAGRGAATHPQRPVVSGCTSCASAFVSAIHQTAQRARGRDPGTSAQAVVSRGWRVATCGPANATSCRRWWTRERGASAISLPTGPKSGPTCCGTSTAHPLPQRRRTGHGPRQSSSLCRTKACNHHGPGKELAWEQAAGLWPV